MAVKLDLNLTEKEKAALKDLLCNYTFMYHKGKLYKSPKADTPIIVEGPLVKPGITPR